MPATFTIQTDIKQLGNEFEKIVKRFPKQLDIAVNNAGNKISGELKKVTPKQSGNLARGYVVQKKKAADYIVTNNVKTKESGLFLSDLLEVGTKAHGPKKAKALRFVDLGRRGSKRLGIPGRRGTGKVVFTKFVKGIKAMKIFERTEKAAIKIVRSEILNRLKLIIKKFNAKK